MRVLITEQTYDGGHYLNYVRHLIQAFAPLGCEIVVAVPNAALESARFKTYLSSHQSRFQLEFVQPREYASTSVWRMIQTEARVYRELIDRVRPDAVYFPTLEQRMAQWVALPQSDCLSFRCEGFLLGFRPHTA
jgi:hypothetical protein